MEDGTPNPVVGDGEDADLKRLGGGADKVQKLFKPLVRPFRLGEEQRLGDVIVCLQIKRLLDSHCNVGAANDLWGSVWPGRGGWGGEGGQSGAQ